MNSIGSHNSKEGNSKEGYKIKIFNKDGNENSNHNCGLEYIYYIEATYINNKPYALLSGNYHAESYNYGNGKVIKYISRKIKTENQCCNIINLFNKDNKLYLLSGYDKGSISIFDFKSAEEINSIKIGDTSINGLCSFNEKYFLVVDRYEVTVINFENEKKIIKINTKSFKGLDDKYIFDIKKIKILIKVNLL